MSEYSMDMSEEKEPKVKQVLPEGWRKIKITDIRKETSKAGNEMFIFEFTDTENQYSEDFYAVATKGKRWNLKSILSACGISADSNGEYKWGKADVLDKEIKAFNQPEDNEYINRNGDTVQTKQNRFTKFEQVAWDE